MSMLSNLAGLVLGHKPEPPELPQVADVVVVGAGPAGLMANLCLTTYGFQVLQIDERAEPTTAGRADGIQPRTIEVLRNIAGARPHVTAADKASGRAPFYGSMAKRLISQGVRVYEVAFWDPTETEKLARTSRAASCPGFIDIEDNYTLLEHQGMIEHAFMDETEGRRQLLKDADERSFAAPQGGVFRSTAFKSVHTLPEGHDELAKTHPVEAVVTDVATGKDHTVRCKYLFGNDGARSQVRKCIAGGEAGDGEWKGAIQMEGEATDIVWGVMDAKVQTDFPDIKYKCLIHSRDAGSIMLIPRENNMVRFYVQLKSQGEGAKHVERSAATQDVCIESAKRIFEPYRVDFQYVDWFSVYQIGQRVATKYTLDHRVFVAGDACHTHSPKAGQGMNISMLDTHNLSWKINFIEKGIGRADVLLPTYELERRSIAQRLIQFDSEYSKLFSGRSPAAQELTDEVEKAKKSGAVDPQRFIQVFKQNAQFTSGVGAIYTTPTPLTALPEGDLVKNSAHASAFNPQGTLLVPGHRLTPGKVTRVMDANIVRLQQEIKMNGSFRIYILAGELPETRARLEAFGQHILSDKSFVKRFMPADGIKSSLVDGPHTASNHFEPEHDVNPFFTFSTVISTSYHEWEADQIPVPFSWERHQIYCDNIFDKRMIEAGNEAPLHRKYGIDPKKGAILAVRPDMYIGTIVDLSETGFMALEDYFNGFLKPSS